MDNLFAYGTLMVEDILYHVTGQTPPPGEPALLQNFARYGVRGEAYPAIVPEDNNVVTGVIYRELDADTLAAVDRYEGDWYVREVVDVALTTGGNVRAFTYVLAPAHRHRVSGDDWNFDEFCRLDLPRYLRAL